MTTSFFNSRTWLSLALFLGLLVALPTGAFAQISDDAQQRVAAALPRGVTPDEATAEQLAAAVAKALRVDGITPALAGEIVQYALGLPAVQGAGVDAIGDVALQIMNAALDAAPAEAAYVDSITMATVFVVPSSTIEVNAERVRRGQPPLSNAAFNAVLAQPFLGNPPREPLSTPTRSRRDQDRPGRGGQNPPVGGVPPGPPTSLPPPAADRPMTPMKNPGPTSTSS